MAAASHRTDRPSRVSMIRAVGLPDLALSWYPLGKEQGSSSCRCQSVKGGNERSVLLARVARYTPGRPLVIDARFGRLQPERERRQVPRLIQAPVLNSEQTGVKSGRRWLVLGLVGLRWTCRNGAWESHQPSEADARTTPASQPALARNSTCDAALILQSCRVGRPDVGWSARVAPCHSPPPPAPKVTCASPTPKTCPARLRSSLLVSASFVSFLLDTPSYSPPAPLWLLTGVSGLGSLPPFLPLAAHSPLRADETNSHKHAMTAILQSPRVPPSPAAVGVLG